MRVQPQAAVGHDEAIFLLADLSAWTPLYCLSFDRMIGF